jgi:hypothetical protein
MNRFRADDGVTEQFRARQVSDLLVGNPNKRYIYGFIDPGAFAVAYDLNKDCVCPASFYGLLMLIPVQQNVSIPAEYIMIPESIQLTISQFNYANWENGIDKNSDILLIDNAEFKNHLLNGAKYVSTGDIVLPVEKVEEHGYYTWIYVETEETGVLEAFAYPNVIEVIK